MRILIGLDNIGNIGSTYVQAFETLGHEAKLCVFQRNRFYPDTIYNKVFFETPSNRFSGFLSKIAKSLPVRIAAAQEFFQELNKTDIFIYIFTSSYLPLFLDYPIVKLAGKKMITIFNGGDIRFGKAMGLYAKDRGYTDEVQPLLDVRIPEPNDLFLRKVFRIWVSEKYSDLILSSPDMGQLQRKPYIRLHIPLILDNYEFKVHARTIPIIVHAPSNRGYKGTTEILKVIEQLKNEGLKFEFELLENTSNNNVLKALVNSDIVISQLYNDIYATFSEEGMATGNAVLGRYVLDSVPEDPPGVNANRFTLKENLREMILDIDKRVAVSYASRAYVEKNFNHINVARHLLDCIEAGNSLSYDYYPEFYKKLRPYYPAFLWGDVQQVIKKIGSKLKKQH